jgi:single-strand DNA-binding protein
LDAGERNGSPATVLLCFGTKSAQSRALFAASVDCVNSVRLTGSLATDVEVRHYDDRHRASFLLRVERNGTRGVDFLPVVAWNAVADACERLTKGMRVDLAGEIRSRRWEERDGHRRRAVKVVATDVTPAQSQEEAKVAP